MKMVVGNLLEHLHERSKIYLKTGMYESNRGDLYAIISIDYNGMFLYDIKRGLFPLRFSLSDPRFNILQTGEEK